MSHEGGENLTGPREIFEILFKASSERLLSLTIQLGESSPDSIICALCLIILRRDAQAVNKLQMLGENSLAKHLAEKWHSSEGEFARFGLLCSDFQASTRESLVELARIFKVLSEQRLCDPILRNLAYKRALSIPHLREGSCVGVSYDGFREEAVDVCGPQFLDWISTSEDLKSGFYCSEQDEVDTTLKASQNHSASTQCLPSPLQATSSVPSYPTHLEMSIPPTISFQGDRIAPENPQNNSPVEKNAPGPSQPPNPPSESSGSSPNGAPTQTKDTMASVTSGFTKSVQIGNQTTKQGTEPKSAQATNVYLPETPASKGSRSEEEEDEDTFYAFVILHAPEDTDMAESMKEKLEVVVRSEGATFSGDFAVPGRSTLRCVEDAINNSAFALLLLTQNFNTRMLDVKTNTALINSIRNGHKYNTVIPLLPEHNRMTQDRIPMVLATLVLLEENKYFEKKVLKAMSPAKVERQRREWAQEQRAKAQRRENRRLSTPSDPHQVEREPAGGEETPLLPRPARIHIEHAQYIMIGNDSQMTVALSGRADQDESVFRNQP